MWRTRLSVVVGAFATVAVGVSASSLHAGKTAAPKVTHEIIAVYFGTEGTDLESGMVSAVRAMKVALTRQAAATGRSLIFRGVSLEPSVNAGLRHLALLGSFDEVSVGGNWTNSSVVRYLGAKLDSSRTSGIPQVLLLEREVEWGDNSLEVGPEREIGRYVGVDHISTWTHRGAPLPR